MPRNSTAYRDFLAKMRDPKVAKKTHGVMPVKMMKDARFVIDRVLKSWQEIVAASPKTRESLGRALKRIYGINFKQLQKEARMAYIEQHCNKPDRVLMKTLGIKSSATMTALTNELRAQDRLPKVARVTMTKAHGVTFERHARPFEIIMLIKWFPVSASLTAKQLAWFLDKKVQNVNETLKKLREQGFVKVSGKKGSAFVYSITPKGETWSFRLNEAMRDRLARVENTKPGINQVIKRFERRKKAIYTLQLELQMQGHKFDSAKIQSVLTEVSSELIRLKRKRTKMLS